MTVNGKIENIPYNIIIDTGASTSVVGEKFFDEYLNQNNKAVMLYPSQSNIIVADNRTAVTRGMCFLQVAVGPINEKVSFKIIENLGYKVILGVDVLSQWQVKIDFEKEIIKFPTKEIVSMKIRKDEKNTDRVFHLACLTDIEIPAYSARCIDVKLDTHEDLPEEHVFYVKTDLFQAVSTNIHLGNGVQELRDDKTMEVLVFNRNPWKKKIYKNQTIGQATLTVEHSIFTMSEEETEISKNLKSWKVPEPIKEPVGQYDKLLQDIAKIDLKSDSDLTEEQIKIVREFLVKNVARFAVNPKKPTVISKVKHYIETVEHRPFKLRNFRISPKEQDVIMKEVEEMAKHEIIRPSNSPYASPVVLVAKKDGSIRFCVDYRKLNTITKRDNYPLPRIDDTIEKMRGMDYYTSVDLAAGYWHIEINEADKEKTAFTSCAGLWEFNVMEFGLTNAPATFQRLMDEVTTGVDWTAGTVYLDDILVGSKTFEDHLKDLQKLFDKLRDYGLSMKLSKCHFFKKRLIYLGHEMSKEGIKPDPMKVAVIQNLQAPTDISGLRRFLGLTSYYRRFIKGYSKIAFPLNNLLKKNTLYYWSTTCQEAFQTLKDKLVSSPILVHPDFNKPFVLYADASTKGLGVILAQVQNQNEHVIAYASRTLNKAERNYTISELEALAIVWGVTYFRPYLYGSKFTAVTDHSALTSLFKMKEGTPRLQRWALKLQDYIPLMEIRHRPGKDHTNVDTLSRLEENSIFTIDISTGTTYKTRTMMPEEIDEIYTLDDQENDINIIQKLSELDTIKRAQRLDSSLHNIIQYLEKGILPQESDVASSMIQEASQYEIIGELLYQMMPTQIMKNRKTIEPRLVIPTSERVRIMETYHDSVFAGHCGTKKTYFKIAQRYYWKGMYQDVKNYVKTCISCQMRKGKPSHRQLQPMTIDVGRPMELLSMDLMGPLPITHSGNMYIVTFTDHFTRWVEAYALPKSDAGTIAKRLLDVIVHLGPPEKLMSDNGRQFVGKVLQNLEEQLEIKAVKIAAYHQQTNGMTERFNRTLEAMLSQYISDHQKDWDEYLPYVLFAYRTAVHEATNETPFYMMMTRDARIPTESTQGVIQDRETIDDYKARIIEAKRIIEEKAVSHDHQTMMKRLERLSLETHESPFKVGKLVWLYTPSKRGQSKKLVRPWQGPFRIEEMVTPVTCRVSTQGKKPLIQYVHVSRLKLYTSPIRPENTISVADDFDWDKEDINLEIPKVLKRKTQKDFRKSRKNKLKELSKQLSNKIKRNTRQLGKPVQEIEPNDEDSTNIDNNDDKVVENSQDVDENVDVKNAIQGERNSEEFEIEHILDVRKLDGITKYRVKWKGYDEISWLPLEDLTNCQEELIKFSKKRGLDCDQCSFLATTKKGLRTHKKNHETEGSD